MIRPRSFALAAVLPVAALVLSPAPHPALAVAQAPPDAAAGPREAALRTVAGRYYAALAARDSAAFDALWAADPAADAARKARRRTLRDVFRAPDVDPARGLRPVPVTLFVASEGEERVAARVSSVVPRFGRMTRLLTFARVGSEWKLADDRSPWQALAEALADPLAADATRDAKLAAARAAATDPLPADEAPTVWLAAGDLAAADAPKDPARRTLALALYERARRAAEERNDADASEAALVGAGGVHMRTGRFAEAGEVFRAVLALREAQNDRPAAAAGHTQLGGIAFNRGDMPAAREAFERAYAIYAALGPAYEERAAALMNNVAVVRDEQGDLPAALEAYGISLAYFEKKADKESVASILNNLGGLHRQRGELRQALLAYARALDLRDTPELKGEQASVLNNIGSVYQLQGDFDQSAAFLRRAIALHEANGDKNSVAQSLANLAGVEGDAARWGESAAAAARSIALFEEIGNTDAALVALHALGRVEMQREDFDAARTALRRSLESARRADRKGLTAIAASSLCDLETRAGRPADALTHGNEAAALARTVGDPYALVNALTYRGRAYRALGRDAEAAADFEAAARAVEENRAAVVGGAVNRAAAFAVQITPFREIIETRIAAGRWDEAFAWAERAKGRTLVDILSGGAGEAALGALDQSPELTAAERARVRRYTAELTALNRRLAAGVAPSGGPADEKERTGLEEKRRALRLEDEAYRTGLYAAHPALQLRAAAAERFPLVTAADAAALLPAGGAAVEFVVTEKTVAALVMTRPVAPAKGTAKAAATVRGYVVPITPADLRKRVDAFRRKLADRDPAFAADARALYALLLGPARADLADRATLLLVPDGPLWNLPFQALLAPGPGERYVADTHAVTYAPSLTALRALRDRRKRGASAASGGERLVAVGNPFTGRRSAPGAAGVGDVLRGGAAAAGFAPLPQAEREVRALARLYGPARSTVFIGASAAEAAVKPALAGGRVLHLATHGVLNDAAPLHSFLLLSQPGGGAATTTGADEDGLLEARELMTLPLGSADLVVLSACETAQGRVGAGEGLIGMSWAAIAAGCSSTVVSQWKVDSAGTSALMTGFHGRLRAGDDKAAALRRAGADLRKDPRYRHPFYWAGFVVLGDWRR